MSESNRPPQSSAIAQDTADQAAARVRARVRRTKRLRVPVDDVPRLSDRPPAMAVSTPSSSPPPPVRPSSPPPATERQEAATVKLRTTPLSVSPPPPSSVVNIVPSVVVGAAQVVSGTPSRPPQAMAAATEQMHKETHASILPPPAGELAPGHVELPPSSEARRSDRAPRVILDDSDDTLVEVPITLGATTKAKPEEVTSRLSEHPPAQPAVATATSQPESVPPARLDDDDLDDATEEDLKGPHAIAAPLPPAPRLSMPQGAPPPPPVRMSAPPPVPAGTVEAPTVVRLPPRPAAAPAGPVSMPPPASMDPAAVGAATQEAQKKKKRKSWWEDFFNDDFLRTV
ncbi:MAG: hypothetical protein IPK60_24590 [Sandaracinaceae bacterium]|nr:hypothetical protein [Sandaracinaceae bacterium]